MNKTHITRLYGLVLLVSMVLPSEPYLYAAPDSNARSSQNADAAITLDPFEISATSDKSYGELNSNSITAFKTALDRVPVSADVFDQALMEDTGMNSIEQTLSLFSAGAGSYSTSPDNSAANQQYLDRNANGSLSLRGLATPAVMLNGFFPTGGSGITGAGITSTFDTDKVEVINGPQSLLYGVSGAGGVVNVTLKQARFSTPSFGAFMYRLDQYGHKLGQLDYGVGTSKLAVRIALINQTLGGRRVFIGGPMQGEYMQIALKPFKNTTLRLTVDDQMFNRINATSGLMTFTALSTSNDARNGQYLHYLLATNQMTAAANGAPSGAGAITGITWDNIDALAGGFAGEFRGHHQYMATIDTRISASITTQISAGYRRDTDQKVGNGITSFNAPNVLANPTGTFAMGLQSSAESALWEPSRQKVARISILSDNTIFGIHSQSIFGADTTRTDGAVNSSLYVLADQNNNPVLSGTTVANGYQIMPTLYWPIPNGPVQQPYFKPLNPIVSYNGLTYVREIVNGTNPALISASNPEGLTGNATGDFRHTSNIQSGIYAANFSEFFKGNLNTLLGFRIGKQYDRSAVEASLPSPPSVLSENNSKFTSYNVGLNFKIHGDLRGYIEASSNSIPAGNSSVDPYGKPMQIEHGLGEEAGLKATLPQYGMSGSLAVFHASSKNETLSFTSTIGRDINPSGLNGVYNNGTNLVNVDRNTEGLQLALTASPGNWRLRFSAAMIKATIGSDVSYKQLYNDQFYANSAGNVTYADGALVYVAPTYNSKAVVIAAPAATAPSGYVPLTISMMNDSTSPYYANPLPVSSAIANTSGVFRVLQSVDSIHGKILTGLTGLPISALQIAPNPTAPPPGVLVVTSAGDIVGGAPRFSMSTVGVYTVPSGALKGFRIGGTGTFAWKTSMYYYYSQGITKITAPRVMFYQPTQALINGIFGWEHKFRKVNFSTQVNISNVFNHYHVLILPSYVGGYAGPNNATFDQQPRFYTWTNTVKF
jgi:outer membrane receptor protein involved in Fe transport